MDDRIVEMVKGLVPGAEVLKVYKGDSGEIKIDLKSPDLGEMTCLLKKNHAGEFYLD